MKKNLIFLAVLVVGVAGDLHGTVVLPLSLKEMADQSERIFLGRVLDVEPSLDEQGIPATLVRFQVLEAVKGVTTGEQVLVKQFAGTTRRSLQDGSLLLTPKSIQQSAYAFTPGEQVVVFLYPESRLGFTSPVGYGQGCFSVTDVSGKKLVSNAWQNHFLKISSSTMRALSLPSTGPLELNSFLQLVREIKAP